ncbi:hypothetical protein MPER_14958, partial [Moniliophthora perniciosa FA553]
LDDTDVYFGVPLPLIVDAVGNVQVGPTNYTFDESTGDFPTFIYRLVFGTALFRLDLVEATAAVAASLNGREVEPLITFPHAKIGAVKTVGPLAEVTYTERNDESLEAGYFSVALDSPTFANGTAIPAGSYKLLARALRVTGDPANEEDYDSWLSPIVGFFPA